MFSVQTLDYWDREFDSIMWKQKLSPHRTDNKYQVLFSPWLAAEESLTAGGAAGLDSRQVQALHSAVGNTPDTRLLSPCLQPVNVITAFLLRARTPEGNGDSSHHYRGSSAPAQARHWSFIIWASLCCLHSQVSVVWVWSLWTVQSHSLYSDCYTQLNNGLIHIQSLDLWKTQTGPTCSSYSAILSAKIGN